MNPHLTTYHSNLNIHIIVVLLLDTSTLVPGESIGQDRARSVKILVFPSPTVYRLWSFGFPSWIWSIYSTYVLLNRSMISWSLELPRTITQTQPVQLSTVWANQPVHSFLVGCLNPCLSQRNECMGCGFTPANCNYQAVGLPVHCSPTFIITVLDFVTQKEPGSSYCSWVGHRLVNN